MPMPSWHSCREACNLSVERHQTVRIERRPALQSSPPKHSQAQAKSRCPKRAQHEWSGIADSPQRYCHERRPAPVRPALHPQPQERHRKEKRQWPVQARLKANRRDTYSRGATHMQQQLSRMTTSSRVRWARYLVIVKLGSILGDQCRVQSSKDRAAFRSPRACGDAICTKHVSGSQGEPAS